MGRNFLLNTSTVCNVNVREQLGTYQGQQEPRLLDGAAVAEEGDEEDETSGENQATAELLEGQRLINFLDRLRKLRGQLEDERGDDGER